MKNDKGRKDGEGQTYRCRTLMAADLQYASIAHLLRTNLPYYVEQDFDIKFDFTLDFEDDPSGAWQRAQTSHYDLFIIDGTVDNNVRTNRRLSEALKDLHPDVPIIATSAEACYLIKERWAYDVVLDLTEVVSPRMAQVLAEVGIIPEREK